MNPNISRRPNSISSELESLNTPGSAEKLSIEPTSPKPGPTLPIDATAPEKLVIRSTPNIVPKTATISAPPSGITTVTFSSCSSTPRAKPPVRRVARDLGVDLSTVVGTQDGRAVVLNPASGVVMVKAMPSELRAVEDYLRMTQLIAERQVMLEAKIIQVQLNEQFQAGVNWNYFGGGDNRFSVGAMQPGVSLNTGGKANSASTSTGGVIGPGIGVLPGAGGAAAATKLGSGFFGLAFQSANFAALLNFLETQGNVQVLSSPRIASVNNQKAVLKVGTDEFFVTNVSTTTTSGGSSNTTTPSITLQPMPRLMLGIRFGPHAARLMLTPVWMKAQLSLSSMMKESDCSDDRNEGNTPTPGARECRMTRKPGRSAKRLPVRSRQSMLKPRALRTIHQTIKALATDLAEQPPLRFS